MSHERHSRNAHPMPLHVVAVRRRKRAVSHRIDLLPDGCAALQDLS